MGRWRGSRGGEVASGTSSVPEVRDYGRVVDDDDVWWGFVMGFVMCEICDGF